MVVVRRGRSGAFTFAFGHATGATPGVPGDNFFKEALLGRGRPEPAPPSGSRPAGVFLQLKLYLVVSHPALIRGTGRRTTNRGVIAAHFLLCFSGLELLLFCLLVRNSSGFYSSLGRRMDYREHFSLMFVVCLTTGWNCCDVGSPGKARLVGPLRAALSWRNRSRRLWRPGRRPPRSGPDCFSF